MRRFNTDLEDYNAMNDIYANNAMQACYLSNVTVMEASQNVHTVPTGQVPRAMDCVHQNDILMDTSCVLGS